MISSGWLLKKLSLLFLVFLCVDQLHAQTIVNPKIEFPFNRFYGLTISPMLQVNKDRIYVGIGIGQMIGFLRR